MGKIDFILKRIAKDDIELIKFVYKCQINENYKQNYTSWPVNNGTIEYDEKKFKEFSSNLQNSLKFIIYYVLIDKQNNPLGFLQFNNYNFRNQSAEIGFYFPKENRRKGFGNILIKLFLDTVFDHKYFRKINKIYGETCETNEGSIKLFKNSGFHLDGVMREHYWFGEQRYNQLIFSLLKADYKKNKTNLC